MTKKYSLTQLSKETLINAVKDATSLKETLLFLGYSSSSGSMFNILKEQLKLFSIDISHFKRKDFKIYNIEDILVENSSYLNTSSLKGRILKNNLLEYKCSRCGNIGKWEDEKLSLQIEHKNGISNDHRLENLTFLCPNCHSLTSTYSGRNNKKKSKEEILSNKESFLINKSKAKKRELKPKTAKLTQKTVLERKIIVKKEIPIEIYLSSLEVGIAETAKKYNKSERTIIKWLKILNKFDEFKKNQKPVDKDEVISFYESFGLEKTKIFFSLSDRRLKKILNISFTKKSSLENYLIEDIYNSVIENGYKKTAEFYNLAPNTIKKFLRKRGYNPIEKKSISYLLKLIVNLKSFIEKNSKLPSEKDDKELYNFIANMREKKKINSLKTEETEILNEVSTLILNPVSKESQWLEIFNSLEKFVSKEKRFPKRTNKDKEEMKLAEWIRASYRYNNPERISKIEALFQKYGVSK